MKLIPPCEAVPESLVASQNYNRCHYSMCGREIPQETWIVKGTEYGTANSGIMCAAHTVLVDRIQNGKRSMWLEVSDDVQEDNEPSQPLLPPTQTAPRIPQEIIDAARKNIGEWQCIGKRYWANQSSWPSDVRTGKMRYLGGRLERWEARCSPTTQIDEDGRTAYWVWIVYLGKR